MIDLARNAIKEKEKNEYLYQFLKDQLIALDEGKVNLKFTPIYFCIKLSQFLGFALDNNYSEMEPYFDLMHGQFVDNDVQHKSIMDKESSTLLFEIMNQGFAADITKDQRNKILDFLIKYYELHVEGFKGIKSISVIRQVLG